MDTSWSTKPAFCVDPPACARVVLFVDFRKPLHFPANSINWLLLHLAVFTPFIREGIEKEKAGNESSTQKRSHCGIDKTSQPLLDLAFNRG